MEIRIYISVKNNLLTDTKYQRTEGGSWFCETIDTTRRTFQVKDRFFLDKVVVEVLEKVDPDYVSLPCWPLPSTQWSEVKNATYTVEHFPEFDVIRFSPKALEETELQDWFKKANISMDELKKKLLSV